MAQTFPFAILQIEVTRASRGLTAIAELLVCVLYFQRVAWSQHISDLHKFALRPHHVWKYGRYAICDGWD